MSKGEWKPLKVLQPFNDLVKSQDARNDLDLLDCNGNSNSNGLGQKDDFTRTRILSVAAWQWQPDTKCQLRVWNTQAFIRHCLSSPRGIFFVGDQSSNQMLRALTYMIGAGDKELLFESSDRPGRLRGSREFFVNPKHEFFSLLLEEGSYSHSRLQQPVLTRLTTYHLLSDMTLRQLLPRRDALIPAERVKNKYPYGPDADWPHSVEDSLASYDQSLDTSVGYAENTQKTIVLLQTGLHWDEVNLSSPPKRI